MVAGLHRQFADRARGLEGGARSIGWKVGFGAPTALETMQIGAPLLGYLTDTTVVAPGATVDVAGWTRGVVEFEVAVHMGADLGPDATVEDARGAVAALAPAIELADITIDPLVADAVEGILASNIFHRAVIFGAPDRARAGLDIDGLVARALVDGAEHAVTSDLEAITGSYDEVVATVAGTLAAMGETLRAGDVIITGSVFPPVPIERGREFVFELTPMEPVSVSLG